MTAGFAASWSGTYIHISLSPGLLPKSRTWDKVAADPAEAHADARKRVESFIVNDPAGLRPNCRGNSWLYTPAVSG